MRTAAQALAMTFAVVVSGAAALGCMKPVFTQGVRDRYGLSPADLQRVQFFTSDDITLRREVAVQSRKVEGNGLAVGDEIRVHETTVAAGTPCVAIRVEGNFVLVSFARQRLDSALWFALERGDDAGVPASRRYRLVELENGPLEQGPFEPRWSKGFLVTWKGEKYRVASGREAYLLYEITENNDRERITEKPPGWRLKEGAPRPSANAERSALSRPDGGLVEDAGTGD